MDKQNPYMGKIEQKLKQYTEDIFKLICDAKTEKKVVCFIDIMGMKRRMCTQSSYELATIYALLIIFYAI